MYATRACSSCAPATLTEDISPIRHGHPYSQRMTAGGPSVLVLSCALLAMPRAGGIRVQAMRPQDEAKLRLHTISGGRKAHDSERSRATVFACEHNGSMVQSARLGLPKCLRDAGVAALQYVPWPTAARDTVKGGHDDETTAQRSNRPTGD